MDRIYPIRLTRNKWKIPFYTLHACSKSCYDVDGLEGDDIYDIPVGYNCGRNKKNEKTQVHLTTFDMSNPRGLFGDLIGANEIVIPDDTITLVLGFPLRTNVNIKIKTCNRNFSLREIIYLVQAAYKNIYYDEEISAPSQTFILEKVCQDCNIEDVQKSIEVSDGHMNSPRVCTICMEEMTSRECPLKLSCDHYFHRDCLVPWINEENKKNCPNCQGLYI